MWNRRKIYFCDVWMIRLRTISSVDFFWYSFCENVFFCDIIIFASFINWEVGKKKKSLLPLNSWRFATYAATLDSIWRLNLFIVCIWMKSSLISLQNSISKPNADKIIPTKFAEKKNLAKLILLCKMPIYAQENKFSSIISHLNDIKTD